MADERPGVTAVAAGMTENAPVGDRSGWTIDRIVHFDQGEVAKDGTVYFGFHDRHDRHFAIAHRDHYLGLVGSDDRLQWTVAAEPVSPDVPNIPAALAYPMFVDSLSDGEIVVSNFGDARLYRIDVEHMTAALLVDGHALGLVDMGNAVVDDDDRIWVNEVRGCRVWVFGPGGRVLACLGDGTPGFQQQVATFATVRFNWIYDMRRGPDGNIYVLDSGNFALRVIDPIAACVGTLAGNGTAGYTGDGASARDATFGSDPVARFDGPISLSLDAAGNAYVGDRFNHVLRMVDARSGVITTIAGRPDVGAEQANDPKERDPLRARLPAISSMDLWDERLFVPTDLDDGSGDLLVFRRA